MSNNKELLKKIGFLPKENVNEIFYKKFHSFDDYIIEVDFFKNKFNFGSKIKSDSSTTQNFSQEENWVVLECVNRLLEKGYKPEDITLEKIYPTGHGTSGRLDILVKKDKKAYLMIECKTFNAEYDKALKKMQKDGGQLFTYFQQDRDTQYLMLYASQFEKGEIDFKCEIIKIEDHYREAGNVKDLYDRWNKLSKSNGIFDSWVNAYEFQNKALTVNDLKIIKQEDSSFIFNRFLEILRQNVVSDKPNAFNKIFTLFLCKIVDEDRSKDDQLHFQYLEGEDDDISFQKRLTDLYKRGMHDLLEKDVVDIGDEEFRNKFGSVDEKYKTEFLKILTEVRLKKNNEFAFKEVFDDSSFIENAKVVKEVVELLQGYKIRYNKKHQYLGDFFELLLTTGLKQESGQFFTPVPVAKYIIKSLPIKEIIQNKISRGNPNDIIPFTIDYAAGSGHFLIESMENIQRIIDSIDENGLNPQTARKISAWKKNEFEWAFDYMYGIEKDYRLVKTAKVGCYLHGDGLAKVIHGDGLGTFGETDEYRGVLIEKDRDFNQDNKQFDVVISNPPYSVSSFKGNLIEENAKKSFDLYDKLTDQSSEIECLFVERTKQLLKDNGLAGIILPSSILSNTGIYTKTREIIFKFFEIIGITELGSGTFMATGTNTVILFLRRRNNYEWENIKSSIDKFFKNHIDITVSGVENIFSKYVKKVWDGIGFEDYVAFCSNLGNKNIENHEIYKEYKKKLNTKDEKDLYRKIIEKEKDKILYFILAYNQKIVLVKSGQKKEEKKFLGYEFSNRRGCEGIHPIQKGKSIDECTKMYNSDDQEDETKVSSYMYKAFLGVKDQKIDKSLEKNIFISNLVDMMTFDRADFEKNISLSVKKNVKIEDVWNTNKLVFINEIAYIQKGTSITQDDVIKGDIPVIAGGQSPAYFHNKSNRDGNVITISASGAYAGFVNYFEKPIFASDCNTVLSKDEEVISTKLIYQFLKSIQKEIYNLQRGQAQPHVYAEDISKIKLPLPSLDIQKKIISEINNLEAMEEKTIEEIRKGRESIIDLFNQVQKKANKTLRLSDENIFQVSIGKRVLKNEFVENGKIPVYSANVIEPFGLVDKLLIEDFSSPSVLWGIDGDWMVNYLPKEYQFYPTDHCGVLRVKDNSVNEKYLAFALEKEGKVLEFSRTKRASIDRIQGIKIKVPSIAEQIKIVKDIENIENQILKLNKELEEIKNKRNEILKKYL